MGCIGTEMPAGGGEERRVDVRGQGGKEEGRGGGEGWQEGVGVVGVAGEGMRKLMGD